MTQELKYFRWPFIVCLILTCSLSLSRYVHAAGDHAEYLREGNYKEAENHAYDKRNQYDKERGNHIRKANSDIIEIQKTAERVKKASAGFRQNKIGDAATSGLRQNHAMKKTGKKGPLQVPVATGINAQTDKAIADVNKRKDLGVAKATRKRDKWNDKESYAREMKSKNYGAAEDLARQKMNDEKHNKANYHQAFKWEHKRDAAREAAKRMRR